MTANTLIWPVVLCAFLVGSLVVPLTSATTGVALDAPSASICSVWRHADDYIGKVIHLRAIYKSDQMYYAALFDESCDSQKTIDVEHPIRTHGDDSVTAFYHEESERCRKLNQLVCPVEADIDADVLIRKRSDEGVIAEFMHVRSYKLSP
ncbi:hypothetical protein [Dyella subtropica]|uniref:hypothetical protein n=1 Tax=Dyella subtropica TaxID=2992127 RepID=UPI00225C051F|nr:hypothetical protein [Dyella subtropica]